MLNHTNPKWNNGMLNQQTLPLRSENMKILSTATKKWHHITAKYNSIYYMDYLRLKIKLSHLNAIIQSIM